MNNLRGFWAEDLEKIGHELREVRSEMAEMKRSLEDLKEKRNT